MLSALGLAKEMGVNPEIVRAFQALEGDRKKGREGVIYLPALTRGMIEGGNLFTCIRRLHESGRFLKIAVNGSDGRGFTDAVDYPTAAWPGAIWYVESLERQGIPRNAILPLHESPQRHTLQETEALLKAAHKHNWRNIVVVSVDYHRVRQLLGMVKQMQTLGRIKVYLPSFPFQWHLPLVGSQGAGNSTGHKEARNEWFNKIATYQEKGDLATFPELHEYINWRDGK